MNDFTTLNRYLNLLIITLMDVELCHNNNTVSYDVNTHLVQEKPGFDFYFFFVPV